MATACCLQGWIHDPHKIEPRLLIDSGNLNEHVATFGTFQRSDLAAPALGFAALVRLDEHGLRPRVRSISAATIVFIASRSCPMWCSFAMKMCRRILPI